MKQATKGRKHEEPLAVRTTGRIKKAKVVFDPSDNYLPKNQRTSAGFINSNQPSLDNRSDSSNDRQIKVKAGADLVDASYDIAACFICRRKESKKFKIKLLQCKDCSYKVHITCLSVVFEDESKLRENFRCDACQICSSCFEGREDGDLITCTKCVKSFHFGCHIPSMARFPTQQKWFCSKCTIPNQNSLLKISENSAQILTETKLTTPIDKKMEIAKPETIVQKERKNDTTDKKESEVSSIYNSPSSNSTTNSNGQLPNSLDSIEIPVVKSWTAGQVMEFFMKFFPEEALVFKDQDIDGQSLLLMKRSDVVNKLAIKLGPALRIYNLILKIQLSSNDPTLGW